MACNCGKARLAPDQEYVVKLKDGSEQTGFESEMQARVAAAKLGGVVTTRPAQ